MMMSSFSHCLPLLASTRIRTFDDLGQVPLLIYLLLLPFSWILRDGSSWSFPLPRSGTNGSWKVLPLNVFPSRMAPMHMGHGTTLVAMATFNLNKLIFCFVVILISILVPQSGDVMNNKGPRFLTILI